MKKTKQLMPLSNRRKSSFILLFAVSCMLFALVGCAVAESSNVYFWDNATFGAFTDNKTEEFVVAKDATVHFTMRGDIESGEIHVKVFRKDDENEVLFETTNLHYSMEADLNLEEGTYCYILNIIDCKNGSIFNKAEIQP